MSKKVIADFVARFGLDTFESLEPIKGRVVLGTKQLVLATTNTKTKIPLDDVYDINLDQVPDDLEKFFNDTITITYRDGDERRIAIVEADSDHVSKFKTVLFKAILNGSKTQVKHPARRGGRVTNAAFRPAKLKIGQGDVKFVGDESVTVELANITHFQKDLREDRPVIVIRHAEQGQSVTSEFAIEDERKLNLLGRYLRLEYSEIAQDVEDLNVSEEEMEALVAIYSGASSGDLAGMMGMDSSRVTMLFNDLQEKGLIDEGQKGVSLTAQGKLLVSDRIESVNT